MRYLVTWHRKQAAMVDADSPEAAARYATAEVEMGRLVPNTVVVYKDGDLNGDRPIPVHIPGVQLVPEDAYWDDHLGEWVI